MSPDEQAIRALVAQWLESTRAGDVDAVLELMAPDVIFLVAGQPRLAGLGEIASKQLTMEIMLADDTNRH
jgi:uncharacterized protein (TIGR02246 family)